LLAQPALAQNVKVTPLGGQDGEFCPLDRALIFEDPNGTRVLYDPGRTVAGADDPRLGKIDVVLVSHMHGDHVGDLHAKAPNSGACDKPDFSVSAKPNSSAVNIAVAKGAKMVTGSEMAGFFGNKLKAAGGDPKNSVLARFGATQKVGGVAISTVTAIHSNALDPELIGGVLGQYLKEAGIGAYVGEATGYVLKFSNGLVAYLVRRYRHHRRPGQGGARPLQRQAGGDEHRRHLHHRPDRGRLRDQRPGQAERRDRLACQRSRHRRRQGARRLAHRDLHQGQQGAGACAAVGQDHGVQCRRQVRRRVVEPVNREGYGAGNRAVFVSGTRPRHRVCHHRAIHAMPAQ
jgi:hypothetical protein